MWIRIGNQIFDDPKNVKLYRWKKCVFFITLTNIYSWVSVKGVQATGQASSLKREHPALQNNTVHFFTFFFFCRLFLPTWIRTQSVKLIADTDPKPTPLASVLANLSYNFNVAYLSPISWDGIGETHLEPQSFCSCHTYSRSPAYFSPFVFFVRNMVFGWFLHTYMTSGPFYCWYFLLLKLRIFLMLLKLPGDGYSRLCSKKQPPRHNYRIKQSELEPEPQFEFAAPRSRKFFLFICLLMKL